MPKPVKTASDVKFEKERDVLCSEVLIRKKRNEQKEEKLQMMRDVS